MAIITRDVGSFESNKGLIAGKQYSLDGPGEGEVFLLTSDIDSAYGTSPYSYQMGYIKDGKLQYFDMREKLREMDKNVVDVYRGLGWDDRMSKLGQFDGDGIFSVKEGGLYGTKTMDINGQQVTLNAYRAGEGPGQSVMTKYEFVYPDGTTVNKKTKTGLTHSSMRSFLNQAVVKTFSPEYQNLKLGYGEMATSKNGPVMKNLQVLSKQYGGVDTGTLNTYSKQELESFYGAGTATNNFNAIDTQYQAYTQTPEYQQTQPGFIKQTETKVGEGAGSYQDIKDQPTVVPPNLVGVDDNRPQPDFQAASTGQIVQNPNAPEGWGNDPTTGKMVKISDYNAGGDSGWYDEVTGDSTPVGVGTPRPTETQQQPPSNWTPPAEETPAEETPGEETPTGETGDVDPQAAYAVNSLYRKYFDRDAREDELNYWVTQPLSELDIQLKADYENPDTGAGHPYDGSPIPEGETKSKFDLEGDESVIAAHAIIDKAVADGIIPQDVAELWKNVVSNYPPGVEYDNAEILAAFKKTRDETIDPYFQELTDIAMKDFQKAYESIEGSRTREMEAQNTQFGEEIRQAKSGLEKSGMTFTGEAIEQLGGESAFSQEGQVGEVPGQIPFGGMFYEGLVPQSQRLLSTSTSARYQDTLQQLGRSAEGMLGTEQAGGLGIPFESAGVDKTGQLAERKEAQEASALQALINQYKEKQQSLTNI